VSVFPEARNTNDAPTGLRVSFQGSFHPAEQIARGAAFELFSTVDADGFRRVSRAGAPAPFHRYVHASEAEGVRVGGHAQPGLGVLGDGTPDDPLDAPLLVPLSRGIRWSEVHHAAQSPAYRDDPVLAGIRRTAAIRRGTRMIKVLSPGQLAGYLRGWLPYGFCYREYDVAHLRTPADLALLRTDAEAGRGVPEVIYALRWRANSPDDYEIPIGDEQRGLSTVPPHDRFGAPILGTGFTPSERHLIPEFVTKDMADLPMPANAALIAYTAEGAEVVLYTYQPEQRGWLRMVGPQWRHLVTGVPEIPPDQEYLPVGEAVRSTILVGTYGEREYEAIADLPGGFRVLAMTRAARYPVENVSRRAAFARWRGVHCQVLHTDSGWTRLRLARPDGDGIATLGAQCYERGIYEVWAPAGELTDHETVTVAYPPA
jgi:hypothetical protein